MFMQLSTYNKNNQTYSCNLFPQYKAYNKKSNALQTMHLLYYPLCAFASGTQVNGGCPTLNMSIGWDTLGYAI